MLACVSPTGPASCGLCSTCTAEAKPTLPQRKGRLLLRPTRGQVPQNFAQTLPHAFIMGGCELFCTLGTDRPEVEIRTSGCTTRQEQPRRCWGPREISPRNQDAREARQAPSTPVGAWGVWRLLSKRQLRDMPIWRCAATQHKLGENSTPVPLFRFANVDG